MESTVKKITKAVIFSLAITIIGFVADILGIWTFFSKDNSSSKQYQEKTVPQNLKNEKIDSQQLFNKKAEEGHNVILRTSDNSKVGNIIIGDSNKIIIKQNF